MNPAAAQRILVIKLSALGDIVQALGPMAAIRRHHAGAHVTALTTDPYVALLRSSPYFDDVWLDARPPLWHVPGWLALRHRLRTGRFDRVYDLQTSDRSGFYFRLLGPAARAALRAHPEGNLFLRGLVPRLGFRSTRVLYDRQPRERGNSKYSLARMLGLGIDGITSFSAVPLRMIAALSTSADGTGLP